MTSQPAARAANEAKSNLGTLHMLADATDAEYLADEVEDVDVMTVEQRQALNYRFGEWLGMY